jgi:hypothetical protein
MQLGHKHTFFEFDFFILFIYFNSHYVFNFLFRMIYACTVKYDIYCIQLNVFKMNRYILMFYSTALWLMVILLHYIPPLIALDSTPAHPPPLHSTSLHSSSFQSTLLSPFTSLFTTPLQFFPIQSNPIHSSPIPIHPTLSTPAHSSLYSHYMTFKPNSLLLTSLRWNGMAWNRISCNRTH